MEKINNRKYVKKYGFWASILLTLITLPFIFVFSMYLKHFNCLGTERFTMQNNLYMFWVWPCLILALSFPIMMSCLYFNISNDKKIFGWLGLMFAIMYGAILITNYWLLAALIQESVIKGGASIQSNIFTISGFDSLINSLEEISELFLGISFLFGGLAQGKSRLESWVKYTMLINAAFTISGIIFNNNSMVWATWICYGIGLVSYPTATISLAIWFKKS